jgi:hypothetical protein
MKIRSGWRFGIGKEEGCVACPQRTSSAARSAASPAEPMFLFQLKSSLVNVVLTLARVKLHTSKELI